MKRKGYDKKYKMSVVLMSNTVIEPNAVMIKLLTASIASAAMLSLILYMTLAAFTIIYILILK